MPERDLARVFVALDLPAADKQALAAAIAGLGAAIPSGVRWVNPAGIHLTLKFLGNIDAGMIPQLLEAIGGGVAAFNEPSFPLRLSSLGVFPNLREPRVLWAGVAGDLAALGRLQTGVDQAIAGLGFAREGRPFRPHLTLGRVRDGTPPATRREIGQTLAAANLATGDSWLPDQVHLIRSNRTPQGAIYTSLGSRPLPPGGQERA